MKHSFSEINVKAATITGTILGFLCWVAGTVVYSLTGYGASVFHGYSLFPAALGVVLGAIGGAALGIIYNWTLKIG